MRESLVDAATCAAERLVREKGIPPPEAARIAARAAVRVAQGGGPRGLGEDSNPLVQAAEEPSIASVREAVSPWLWVFSLVSFGMAVANYRRISRMFGDWRSKRRS